MVSAGVSRQPGVGARRAQALTTRALLLSTAERLYAERGLSEVSNRQVADAAGQANNSAVAYHIGTKSDLVTAICRHHVEPIERRTRDLVTSARGQTDPSIHIASLVRPYTAHLGELGVPSWFARFTVQIAADPTFGTEAIWPPELQSLQQEAGRAVWATVPDMPAEVARLRIQMMRTAIMHTCAEREADAARTGHPADWDLVGRALVDAVTGLLLAPVTTSA